MFETECRGCKHSRIVGYFLYCRLTNTPAKTRCPLYLAGDKRYIKSRQSDLNNNFVPGGTRVTTRPPWTEENGDK